MVERLTYRGRNTHRSPSNTVKVVITPGHRHVFHRVKRRGAPNRCALTKAILPGLCRSPALKKEHTSKRQRRISRPYGGVFCAKVVRERILRAFLNEEKRCVLAVMAEKARQKRIDAKRAAGGRKAGNR